MSERPHDRPTTDELLEAVAEFLADEAASSDDRRRRFNLRVAANALAIVRRQMALGAPQQKEHASALRGLGVSDDAALAAAIRSGALDDRYDEVLDVVRRSVRAKLAVANPNYADAPGQAADRAEERGGTAEQQA